jgi:hypothetical protein
MMGGNADELKGITPRIVQQVFENVEKSDETMMFEISVQYVEIYMEKLQDLLDSKFTKVLKTKNYSSNTNKSSNQR